MLAITSQKGGAGKSTLCVHLAVEAMRAGKRVLLIDTDPQCSSLAWGDEREVNEPIVEAMEPARLFDRLSRAKGDGVDLVIVDTAPRASAGLAGIMKLATFIVVVIRPTAFDLATLEQTAAMAKAASRPMCVVLNAVRPQIAEVAEAKSVIQGLGLEHAPLEIGDRIAFARAVASGRAVGEFEPSGRAAAEIAELWRYVAGRLL